MNNLAKNKPLLAIIGLVVIAGASYAIYSFTNSKSDQPAGDGSTQAETSSSSEAEPEAAVKDETLKGDLVSSFPTNQVPLYPGDIVESSSSSDSYGKPQFNVEVKTTDSYDKVDDWTREAYAKDGWEIRSDQRGPIGGRMIIAHSSSHIVTITYDEADDGALINYGVSTK